MGFFKKNKWFIIGVAIFLFAVGVYAAGKMNMIPYLNEMQDLKNQNEKLKKDAAVHETDFQNKLAVKDSRILEIDKKILDLQKRNVQLVKVNTELARQQTELEKKYDALKKKFDSIVVPIDRRDRAAKFRELGY